MNQNDGAVSFLYGTVPGRAILKLIMCLHADRLAVWFLCSGFSRPLIARYAKRHGIPLSENQMGKYHTFRDFFIREREGLEIDPDPDHLISPCDGWLSAFRITDGSSFFIKGSHYRVQDLLEDAELAARYKGGVCLVFRLCASDYHHYCYIDDGYQGPNHPIPGQLHSVQPIACETYPVFTLNRRCWCLLETDHFGPVVQTEIGAMVVGGIENPNENIRVSRGEEKGHFDLAGSTIVLLLEPERVRLCEKLETGTGNGREVRVELGMRIGTRFLKDTERNRTADNQGA